MRINRIIFFAAVVSLTLAIFAVPAYADKCKDPIVDEINAVSADAKVKIENAMAPLGQAGADVRVMFLSSYHRDANDLMHKNLAGYKATMLAKCRSWQAADGGFKNNLILFIAVPKKSVSSVYYGKQWAPMLAPNESRYNSDMTAKFRDGDLVGGMLIGLSDVADLVSIKPSQQNKPVVINHPSDYSGLWKVFGWLIALGALGLLGWLAFWIFGQAEKRRTAQREAKTERGKCSQALNTIEGLLAIAKSKVSQATLSPEWTSCINETLDRAERKYTEAASQFNGLNRSANNADTPRLSVAEYSAMGKRYALIASLFSEAEELVYEAEEALQRALRGDVPPDKTASQTRQVVPEPAPDPKGTGVVGDKGSGGAASKNSAPPVREDTPRKRRHRDRDRDRDKEIIIIRDSPVIIPTPIIIDDRDRPRDDRWTEERRADPNNPVIVEEPSEGGGKETDFGSSGAGGGTAQVFGSSGSGGGSEQSWDKAEPSSPSSPSSYESSDSPRTGY